MKVALSYISAQIPTSLLPRLRWSTPGTFRFWSSAILVLRTQHYIIPLYFLSNEKMQKVLIRPIHIEILPSSTHYRWMLQPLSLWLQDGNEGRGGREEKVIRYWLTLISGLGTAYTWWMKVLARFRMDGTYNQTQPLQYLRRKPKFFSFYLS